MRRLLSVSQEESLTRTEPWQLHASEMIHKQAASEGLWGWRHHLNKWRWQRRTRRRRKERVKKSMLKSNTSHSFPPEQQRTMKAHQQKAWQHGQKKDASQHFWKLTFYCKKSRKFCVLLHTVPFLCLYQNVSLKVTFYTFFISTLQGLPGLIFPTKDWNHTPFSGRVEC